MAGRNVRARVDLGNKRLQEEAFLNQNIEDVQPGKYIPEGMEIRHNTTANRDPLPDDDFSLGYREGSNWFNQLTSTLFICLESNAGFTKWVKSGIGKSQTIAKVSDLIVVKEDIVDDTPVFTIKLDLVVGINIKHVFNVYFLGFGNVLSGWIVRGDTVLFPIHQATSFMRGALAKVAYAVGDTDVNYIP